MLVNFPSPGTNILVANEAETGGAMPSRKPRRGISDEFVSALTSGDLHPTA